MNRTASEIVARVIDLAEGETTALREGEPLDLLANADAKARLLLELTRLRDVRDAPGLTAGEAQSLAEALARNALMLQRHMDAVNQVAGSIAQSIRAMDDDGTYGRPGGARRSA